ncbi:MAG: hypothetical protein AB1598_13550 [Thermodesulfobacteriota bacterium]
MSGRSDWLLGERAAVVFDDIVEPVFARLIEQYGGAGGVVVEAVPDSPLITGLKRYSSIMVRHPNGMEMIVSVYWVEGSGRLIAENIRMVTLSKSFDIFTVTREALEEQVKFLSALGR